MRRDSHQGECESLFELEGIYICIKQTNLHGDGCASGRQRFVEDDFAVDGIAEGLAGLNAATIFRDDGDEQIAAGGCLEIDSKLCAVVCEGFCDGGQFASIGMERRKAVHADGIALDFRWQGHPVVGEEVHGQFVWRAWRGGWRHAETSRRIAVAVDPVEAVFGFWTHECFLETVEVDAVVRGDESAVSDGEAIPWLVLHAFQAFFASAEFVEGAVPCGAFDIACREADVGIRRAEIRRDVVCVEGDVFAVVKLKLRWFCPILEISGFSVGDVSDGWLVFAWFRMEASEVATVEVRLIVPENDIQRIEPAVEGEFACKGETDSV